MRAITAVCFVLCLLGCGKSQVDQPHIAAPWRTLQDARGKSISLAARPVRIVSLAPSITEILYKLGCQNQLEMDTTVCDFPPEAKSKPHLNAFSGSIESVLVHNPDLVIGQDKLDGRMIGLAEKAALPTLVIKADTLEQTFDAIRLIGKATGAESQADQLTTAMQSHFDQLRQAVAGAQPIPKVLLMYGANPLYSTGTHSFITEIIQIAGGVNMVDQPLPSEVISSELVLARRPDVIICSPEVAAQARRLPGWAEGVPAVRNGRFYTSEDNLVRPGPRLADAAEALARYLHPDRFAHSP